MISTFLNHQWKSFWRSRNKGSSIIVQIILGLFMLYLLAVAIGVGFLMPVLLEKTLPKVNLIEAFNGLILYYFMLDIAMRIQLQELPTLSIVPYLHLKIKRKTIVNFLNVRALINFFNFLPLFIFLPFVFTRIYSFYGAGTLAGYVCAILSLTIFNNFLILYVKRKSINNIAYFGIILLAVFVLMGLDYYHIVSIRSLSNTLFRGIALHPYLSIILAAIAFTMFRLNSAFLSANLYTEELGSKEQKKVSTDYAFLNRFGKVGELAALELKLILRHKRSRTAFFMSILFLLYGFIFYKEKLIANNEFGKMLFAAVFMTGITLVNYGQFMFAWQSAHFDGLLVNKIDHRDFIKAKYLLFTLSSTIITILSSFYVVISYKILFIHLAAYFFNIGFGATLVLYIATFNRKRLDITKSASFNWQGVGATQWILAFPLLLLPFVIYVPFGMMNQPYWGLLALGIFGLTALLLRNFFINIIVKRFEKEKYKIAEGFRE
ncbi:DUF5687 family protein [Pedobacter sp.]|uniref:DUF5687 family protein n=1 Tax=Pedobacter sp. TaxID=1411316 RepID=UPI00396C72FF